jgi:hypothetical protein
MGEILALFYTERSRRLILMGTRLQGWTRLLSSGFSKMMIYLLDDFFRKRSGGLGIVERANPVG